MQPRKTIAALKPYVAGKPIIQKGVVKLNANECPYALPASIYKTVKNIRNVERYHEGSGYYLRAMLADKNGLASEQVILGNGSGEIIKTYLETFAEPALKTVVPEVTFSLYDFYSVINGNPVVKVKLKDNLDFDFDAMVEASKKDTAAIFFCSPNNPTGNGYSYEMLSEVFKKIPSGTGIFLDEAYIHFSKYHAEGTSAKLLKQFPNLFILRTFSKLGLAGLRVGYGFGSAEIIGKMHQVRPPFNTSIYSQEAGLQMLKEEKFVNKVIQSNNEQREALSLGLKALGLTVYPSEANFILVKGPLELDKKLEEKKVLIRSAKSFGLSAEYYRITIGLKKENQILLEKLKEVMQ